MRKQGKFRLNHEQFGDVARVAWGAAERSFRNAEDYAAEAYDPPFDELPSRDEWMRAYAGQAKGE